MAQKIIHSGSVIKRNVLYFHQQIVAALKNSSVFVKLVCIIIVLCYFISFSDSAVKIISVTPGFIIPPNFWVWTAFTHCYLENRLWLLVVDIVTLGLCGKLLEPLWGAMEMVTFFALINTSVAFLCVLFYIVVFSMTADPRYLFSVHIHGLSGYCAAVAVALAQVMPEGALLPLPWGSTLRNRHAPLTLLLMCVLLAAFRLLPSTHPLMAAAGFFPAWLYLRFGQRHRNGSAGDPSFFFHMFFPNILQPPMKILCNTIFEFCVYIKVCKKTPPKYYQASPLSSLSMSLPTTDSHDAERRRQIALRALTERLSKVEQSPWPSRSEVKSSDNLSVSISMPPDHSHQPNMPLHSSTNSSNLNKEEFDKHCSNIQSSQSFI